MMSGEHAKRARQTLEMMGPMALSPQQTRELLDAADRRDLEAAGMSSEQQPTMADMRRLVAADDCRMRGHSWDVLTSAGDVPIWVVCSRCGRRWPVDASRGSTT